MILLALLSLPAQAAPQSFAAASYTQVAYFDLAALSGNYFHSRLRVTLTEKFHAPANIDVTHSTTTDDLGIERDDSVAVVSGDPLYETTFDVDEVDADGNVVKSLHHDGYPARQLTTVPPSAQGFLPGVPLLAVHPALGGQVTFRDAGGKQVLTTIEASMQSVLYLDPATKRYWAIEAPTVDMRPTFAFLPEGQNYASEPTFRAQEQAVPADESVARQCRKAGETHTLAPLHVGPDLRTERFEACTAEGTRLVFLRKNPAHEPTEMIQRTDAAALDRGGQPAAKPLATLPNDAVSNCHGYALLATIGLDKIPGGEPVWIQSAEPPTYTSGTRPLEYFLTKYFRKVLSVPASYYDVNAETALARDARLREGDFLTFYGTGGYAHSGVVRRAPDGKSWWIESKFEEGPVLDTPIAGVHDVIPNLYSEIRVYRKNRDPTREP